MVLSQVGFGLLDGVGTEVKDAGGQDGVGFAVDDGGSHMFRATATAAGDDGDLHGLADGFGEFEVVSIVGTVAIHAGENDFTGAESFDFAGPGDGIETGGAATAVGENFPSPAGIEGDAFRIDIDDDALASETVSGSADEEGVTAGCGIDGNLVAAGLEEEAYIFERADAASDG